MVSQENNWKHLIKHDLCVIVPFAFVIHRTTVEGWVFKEVVEMGKS